jgi:hypothetical protein
MSSGLGAATARAAKPSRMQVRIMGVVLIEASPNTL